MTTHVAPAGMSSMVTNPGSGKSIVASNGPPSSHVTWTPKLPSKPSGTSGMTFVILRLPVGGGGIRFEVVDDAIVLVVSVDDRSPGCPLMVGSRPRVARSRRVPGVSPSVKRLQTLPATIPEDVWLPVVRFASPLT